MVYTKGSRFGVFSGHTVRRPEFSYSQLCADQHIVVQSNKSFNRGSQEVNNIQLSMNKKNRWQMTDNLIEEVNVPDCMVIISHHHLKPGQHRRTADCMQVCSQKNGKTLSRDAKSTYARADDLCDDTGDRVMEDDAEAQQVLTKRQRRRRKWYQKVQEQNEDEELLIHCKVYTAPSKHHFQIQPPRGSYSSKSSKTRKGLPGGNASYFQDMYDDEVWDEYSDAMMQEAVEDSLDDLRSNDWVYNTSNNSLEDFILPQVKKTDKSQRKKDGCQRKVTDLTICREKKDRIIHVDKDEVAIPYSHLMASYVPAPRGWVKKKRGRRRNKTEKILNQSSEALSTLTSDEPSFSIPSLGWDDIKDFQISASRTFEGSTFHCSKCRPPRFAVDITPYIHDKLRQKDFVNTIKAMTEMKKKCWIVVERNGKEPQQQGVNQGKESIRLTLVGFPRDMAIESETKEHLIHLHHCSTDRVMKILEEHVEKLTLEKFFTSTTFPSCKPEIKLDVLGEFWEWKQETKSPLQLIDEPDVEDDLSRDLQECFEECFEGPLKDSVTECGICLDGDLFGPNGVTVSSRTALNDCLHWFCNDCWRNYLKAEINRGETRLTCPAFDCKTLVDEITLASFVPASMYNQHKEKQLESMRMRQRMVPCPKEGCGHLLPRTTEAEGTSQISTGLLCACGGVWCSKCREKLHWPSTCQQNEKYKEKFNNGVGVLVKGKIDHVNVKKCPACSYPVEKFGGCMHMVCRCSYSFCWTCGGDWQNHSYSCKEEGSIVAMQVDLVDVVILKSNYDRAVFHNSRSRRSAVRARQKQAENLLSKLFTAVRGSEVVSCPTVHSQKRNRKLVAQSKDAFGNLSQVLQDALRFCTEVEFVLEHLEIFLTSKTILNSSKRKLVIEMKDRLAYLSDQIHQILKQTTSFNILTVSKRLQNLTFSGRKNILRLAATLN